VQRRRVVELPPLPLEQVGRLEVEPLRLGIVARVVFHKPQVVERDCEFRHGVGELPPQRDRLLEPHRGMRVLAQLVVEHPHVVQFLRDLTPIVRPQAPVTIKQVRTEHLGFFETAKPYVESRKLADSAG
jgi:hypothetical protein